jgi:hypothetical protein
VDLGLPFQIRRRADSGVEPGELLVKCFAKREDYPVPALLVISGRLGVAHLPDLQQAVQKEFWYGCVVNKGFFSESVAVVRVEGLLDFE